jgi:hypothetical protein
MDHDNLDPESPAQGWSDANIRYITVVISS